MSEAESPEPREKGLIDKRLAAFYQKHGVGEDGEVSYLKAPYRFIRMHPRYDIGKSVEQLRSQLPPGSPFPVAVPWLDSSFRFYALPDDFPLQQSPAFRDGRLYGQDVSSGAAVAALLTSHHDKTPPSETITSSHCTSSSTAWRVLDLCCAPGLKLCAMADWLRERRPGSTVVGVDVSTSRMHLTQRLVEKHQIDPQDNGQEKVRIRLYRNDGRSFGGSEGEPLNLVFDSTVALEEALHAGKRKRKNKSAKAREQKRLKQVADIDLVVKQESTSTGSVSSSNAVTSDLTTTLQKFDRVLVDAECSTDGSLKHMQKRLEKATQSETQRDLAPRLTDTLQLSELVKLQRELAASGFRLLKPGGVMVYSTCSLSEEQNEGVVEWLLAEFSDSRIVNVCFVDAQKDHSRLVREGNLDGTIRFLPNVRSKGSTSDTPHEGNLFGGGFFLAKIKKLELT